jgi:RNA polymerase sigma-70 factor (ECF subfamily)
MPDLLDSSFLHDRIDRWRSGDRGAADDLLRMVISRLEKLARRMLRYFPNIRGIADTDDVLQNSLLRLLRTLQRLKPKGMRDFFNLAAVHIRRELLDLARRSSRGKGNIPLQTTWTDEVSFPEPSRTTDSNDADRWVLFHQCVDRLPLEEREVVGLIFYHGWTQRDIAVLFKVDERTIRRRWASARQNLRSMIGKDFLED